MEKVVAKTALAETLDGMERTILYLQGQVDGARKALENHDETMRRLIHFMECFEAVFSGDWEYTVGQLECNIPDYVIAEDGTFLEPGIADESDNWANRGALLEAYRALCECLFEEGTKHEQ